jgi:hypothetical protein
MHALLAQTQRYDEPVASYNPTLAAGEIAEMYLNADGRLVVGPELFTGGDCAVDSFSVSGGGFSHDAVNGEYDCDGSQVSACFLYQGVGIVAGNYLCVEYEVKNFSAGLVKAVINGSNNYGPSVGANGMYRCYILATAGANGNAGIYASSDFVGSIDNLSIKKVTSPFNCIRIALNTNDGHLHAYKRVAGVETSLIDVAINYAAGNEVRTDCRRSGASVLLAVFYDDDTDSWKRIGTTQTISDSDVVAGKYHYAGGDGSGTFKVRRRAETSEQATGTCTLNALYRITATEVNHFFVGCAIDGHFVSDGTETLDASNKVRAVLLP